MKTILLSVGGVLVASVAAGAPEKDLEGAIQNQNAGAVQKSAFKTEAKAGVSVLSALNSVRNADRPRAQGEFLVTVSKEYKANPVEAPAIKELVAQGGKVLKKFRSSPTVLIKMPAAEGSSLFSEQMGRLSNSKSVKNIEANARLHKLAVPNDDRFSELYGMNNIGQTGGRPGVDIDAPEAWDSTVGSKDVLVGIIDTGLDYTHPDLSDNVWINPGESGLDQNGQDKSKNGIDDDGNGYIDDFRGWDFVNNDNDPMDDQGHGTHTAGTIGAKGNNRIGVAGVNWNVSLVSLKFLGADGSGTLDAAVEAIEYATKLGVRLTSNSWGGGGFSETMEAAIKEAQEKGILFVAAAGNEVNDNDASPSYPASYKLDNVISVAATDQNDDLAYFSNYGKKTVHLAAPGVDILSTTPGGKYEKLSGTSMACPHVAGAAALVWSKFPMLDYKAIKARLISNVTQIASVSTKTIGGGRLSLPASLETDETAPSQVQRTMVDSVGLFSAKVSWDVSGDDKSDGRARMYEVRYINAEQQAVPSVSDWEQAEILGTVSDLADASRLGLTIEGVSDEFKGYLAVRAIDNVGNKGVFSEPIYVQLADRVLVNSFDATNTEGIVFQGKWGVENVEGIGQVFSDSPTGDYDSNANFSMTLPMITGDFSKETYLTFPTSYDLEPRYDFGIVEARAADSDSWKEIYKVNGSAQWNKAVVKIPALFSNATSLQIRFRLTSDLSIDAAGWLIGRVNVIQAP